MDGGIQCELCGNSSVVGYCTECFDAQSSIPSTDLLASLKAARIPINCKHGEEDWRGTGEIVGVRIRITETGDLHDLPLDHGAIHWDANYSI